MKIVLLAGGLGTRLREETEFKPKPMVCIGERPIIWHIMKNFSEQGFHEFVIAVGYKGEVLNDYMAELAGTPHGTVLPEVGEGVQHKTQDGWEVTIVNTGLETLTGARLLRCAPFTDGRDFLCTYGDGLSDIVVENLIDFHNSHGRIGTVTAAHPVSRFGVLGLGEDSQVLEFREKQIESTWVNAGYFVFTQEIFSRLDSINSLEEKPLKQLVSEGQLFAWKHEGSWKPMDTHREKQEFESLWQSGQAFWKNWV